MTLSENILEIHVRVIDETVIVTTSDQGERSGLLQFEDVNSLQWQTIQVLKGLLDEKDRIKKRVELEVLGRHLFDLLFDRGTGAFLFDRLKQALTNRQRVRVLLDLSRARIDLANLPWEYLYYFSTSDEPFFLSTRADLVLVRFLPLERSRHPLVAKESVLRLLLVVASPPGLPVVEAEQIVENLRRLADRHTVIHLELMENPTVVDLEDRLAGFCPHVFHFIGHGQLDSESHASEVLLLNNNRSGSRRISDRELAEILTHNPTVPRLVVLHLCDSEESSLEANFASMAPGLVQAGVQAVVAMQHRFPNPAAETFARAFYRELASGSPVDSAVQAGRYRITREVEGATSSRVFGTPVLYMHSIDGVLLPASPPERETSSGGSPPLSNAAGRLGSAGEGDPAGAGKPLSAELRANLIVAAVRVARAQGLERGDLNDLFAELFPSDVTIEALRQTLTTRMSTSQGIYVDVCRAIQFTLEKPTEAARSISGRGG